MNPQPVAAADCRERAVLVAVIRDNQDPRQTEEFLDELEFLAETADICSVKRFTQRLPQPSSRIYVGPGKLEEIAGYCKEQEIDLVGGDTRASMTGLVITVTTLGYAKKEKIVYRSGAQQNDLVCITGNLGAAYMGLQLLEREKRVLADVENPEPQFKGYEYLLEKYLKPRPRTDIVRALAEEKIRPTSMIDLSDGLASDLMQICKSSACGARIYLERIPIARQTSALAEEMHSDPVVAALNGGEDYELLFTVPLSMQEQIMRLGLVDVIGHITPASTGCYLVTPDGQDIKLKAQGFPEE